MRKHLWLVGRPVDSCGSNSDPFVAGCDGPYLLAPSSLNGMAAAKLPKHDNRLNV